MEWGCGSSPLTLGVGAWQFLTVASVNSPFLRPSPSPDPEPPDNRLGVLTVPSLSAQGCDPGRHRSFCVQHYVSEGQFYGNHTVIKLILISTPGVTTGWTLGMKGQLDSRGSQDGWILGVARMAGL